MQSMNTAERFEGNCPLYIQHKESTVTCASILPGQQRKGTFDAALCCGSWAGCPWYQRVYVIPRREEEKPHAKVVGHGQAVIWTE